MESGTDRLYDQLLAVRCQAGDDGAFAELVGRYHERLAYYVARLSGSTGKLEDILQEVWLTVYRKLPALRSPRALSVWLYRVARTTTLAHLRGRCEWAALPDEPAAPAAIDEVPAVIAEDAAQVHAALDRLRPEHKEVLTLRFLEQMSYQQIAAVVGSPLGTVRSRLHHAKQALQRELRGG